MRQQKEDSARRARRRARLIAAGLAVANIAVLGVAGATTLASWRQASYDRNIQRLHAALPAPPPTRQPLRPADPGQNWLLVGSDQRGASTPQKWRIGSAHSDTIMLLHLPEKEKERAYIVSIPRDSYVNVPGHGMSKINQSFALGGPLRLTETVQQLTGIHIDHFAAIDFHGFKEMTDALGGVEIELRYPVQDPTNDWSWPAGRNRLNGDDALHFVRERKGLPSADVDRVKRQHAFLKAMAEKAVSTGTLTNPVKLDQFMQAVSRAIAVDDTANIATLRGLTLRMARVGPEGITFVSVPVGGTAWVGKQNVALLDETLSKGLFEAIRKDEVGSFVERHGLRNDVDRVL